VSAAWYNPLMWFGDQEETVLSQTIEKELLESGELRFTTQLTQTEKESIEESFKGDELILDRALKQPALEFVAPLPDKLASIDSKDVYVGDRVVAFDSSKYNMKNTFETKKVEVTRQKPIYSDKKSINGTSQIIGYEEVTEIVDTGIIATVDFGMCPNEVEVYKVYKVPEFTNDKEYIVSNGVIDGYASCVYGRILYDVKSFSSLATIAAGLTDGIVAYYKLDEKSGTTANNSVVGGVNGTANDARVFTSEIAGQINTSADFTQGNDYITLPLVNLGTSAFTFSAWYYGSTSAGTIVGHRLGINENWRFIAISPTAKFTMGVRTSSAIATPSSTTSITNNTKETMIIILMVE